MRWANEGRWAGEHYWKVGVGPGPDGGRDREGIR